MKLFGLFISLLLSTAGFSQLSGQIEIDERPIVNDISYTLEMKERGKLVFDIAVDVNGKVTSCEWNKIESTINNYRYVHTAKNRILSELLFEAGNRYPTFHRGQITITPTP